MAEFWFKLKSGRIEKATDGSACWDLFATEDATLRPGQAKAVKCGVVSSFDPRLVARICPRSGLEVNKNISVGAGVIDADYPSEWGVALRLNYVYGEDNFNYQIKVGDKIGQFMLLELPDVSMIAEGDAQIIVAGARRVGGFGSTG